MRHALVLGAFAIVATVAVAGDVNDVNDRLDEVESRLEALRRAQASPDSQAALAGLGREVYQAECATCHGAAGDGKGQAAAALRTQPRDFAAGRYKFRTTASGTLPTDEDLYRTVSEGVPGTRMPAWAGLLTPRERLAAVQYLKGFSPRFEREPPREEDRLGVPAEAPSATPERVARGAVVYRENQCAECHGESGRGDGPKSGGLVDDRGNPIRAYDFTRGEFHGGSDPRDVYRTFMTGLDGTPMPSYQGVIGDEDAWALVHYVRSLVRPRTFWERLWGAPEDE